MGLCEDNIASRDKEKQLYGLQSGVIGFENRRIVFENKGEHKVKGRKHRDTQGGID